MADDQLQTQPGEDQDKEEKETRSGGPLSKLMPPDMRVWRQARNLITDKGIRVDELAAACVQDPVIVMELLRVSNALYFSGGRSAITTVKNAIVRLGSEVVLEHLEELKGRSPIENDEVQRWFNVHRSRCRRVAITATILSQISARTLAEDCQTAGLFTSIGEMLAVYHMQEAYVEMATEQQRSALNYQLSLNHHFDVEKMGLKYLRKQGLPESLIFALDRESQTRNPERSIMRPLVLGAAEMVDAFDNNRWEKIAPGKTLPSKSNLRLLRIDDNQYLKVYERVAEYLFSAKLAEQKRLQESEPMPEPEPEPVAVESVEDDELANEIEALMRGNAEAAKEEPANGTSLKTQTASDRVDSEQAATPTTVIENGNYSMENPDNGFNLDVVLNKKKRTARSSGAVSRVAPPQLRTEKGTAIVSMISEMFDDADTSEELLASLLERLTEDGPFEKSALIVVSRDRKNAVVVAARGPNIGNGQRLELDDPLSPLAQCFTKVQSFGNRPSDASPFGSKAFALAPIHADHDTPVALYADCGNNGSLTFEARRIFRVVVDILNEKLPTIPGGIPVEL